MRCRASTTALTTVNLTDTRRYLAIAGAYGLLTSQVEDGLNSRLRKWYDLFAVVGRCVSRIYYNNWVNLVYLKRSLRADVAVWMAHLIGTNCITV